MTAPLIGVRLRPDQPRARPEQFKLALTQVIATAGKLPRPKRTVQRLVDEPRQVRIISIQRFDKTKDRVIEFL